MGVGGGRPGGEPHDRGACSPGGRSAGLRTAAREKDPRAAGRVVLRRPDSDPSWPWQKKSTAARGGATATSLPSYRTHLSFRLPFPVLPGYLSSPSSLVSSPHCFRWESPARHKRGRTLRLRGWGSHFPGHPTPHVLDLQLHRGRGSGIFSRRGP